MSVDFAATIAMGAIFVDVIGSSTDYSILRGGYGFRDHYFIITTLFLFYSQVLCVQKSIYKHSPIINEGW